MRDFVPANDNDDVDPAFVDAVQATMANEERIQEIVADLRHKLAALRRERLRRIG